VKSVIGMNGVAATALDCASVSEELPSTTMSVGFHATSHWWKPKVVRNVCHVLHQRRLIASGVHGRIGVHAPAHVVAASTPVIVALRPLPKVEARSAKRIIAQKLPHATCKVVAQIAEMANGQSGAIGVAVLTLVEVVRVGGHERSKQRQMSVANRQSGFRRSTSSAMKQCLVPKIQIANLAIGVLGAIALALVMA